jgi:hypothetical protein
MREMEQNGEVGVNYVRWGGGGSCRACFGRGLVNLNVQQYVFLNVKWMGWLVFQNIDACCIIPLRLPCTLSIHAHTGVML